MELQFYVDLLEKANEMAFTNEDDKKRFIYIVRRIIKKKIDNLAEPCQPTVNANR